MNQRPLETGPLGACKPNHASPPGSIPTADVGGATGTASEPSSQVNRDTRSAKLPAHWRERLRRPNFGRGVGQTRASQSCAAPRAREDATPIVPNPARGADSRPWTRPKRRLSERILVFAGGALLALLQACGGGEVTPGEGRATAQWMAPAEGPVNPPGFPPPGEAGGGGGSGDTCSLATGALWMDFGALRLSTAPASAAPSFDGSAFSSAVTNALAGPERYVCHHVDKLCFAGCAAIAAGTTCKSCFECISAAAATGGVPGVLCAGVCAGCGLACQGCRKKCTSPYCYTHETQITKCKRKSCEQTFGRVTTDTHGNPKCEKGSSGQLVWFCDYDCEDGKTFTKCSVNNNPNSDPDFFPTEIESARREIFKPVDCKGGEKYNPNECPKEIWHPEPASSVSAVR